MVDESCECGFFAKRIAKIRSRTDEMVVCGMGNVGAWVFEEVSRSVNGHCADWQAVIKHDGWRDVVELRVEMTHASQQSAVELAVLDNLRKGFGDFWKNYEMNLYQSG